MTVRDVAWIGVDAGMASHHAAAIDADGRLLWSVKFASEQRRIEELIARAAGSGGQVRWAVDLVSPMASLLLALLLTSGQDVVYVPGRMVSGLAGALGGEGKTDAKDARVIADIARMRQDLAAVTATDELAVELARLTSHRADLMADWVRGVNRLRELLGSIFPALEAAFDYSTRSALILVTGFAAPAEVRQAGHDGVTAYLTGHGAWRKGISAMAATAVTAAAAQTVTLPGEATTATLVRQAARKLLDLDREIKDTGKLITSRFRTHPRAAIIESLPGMGPIRAPSSSPPPAATPREHSSGPPGSPLTPGSCPCPRTPAASPATGAGPRPTTAPCAGCSPWPPCPASKPTGRPGPSTSANARSTAFTPRPCSRWPGAWSMSCGHCWPATAGFSPDPPAATAAA